MLKINNLCKSYGGQILFEEVSFNVNPKERIGLVGRNGHGKTTLFRLILSLDSADSGSINIPKNYRIGYLKQHLDFTCDTILEEACLGLPEGQEHNAWRAEKILFGLGFSTADLNRPPSEFSGGFQVRLNLTKVLVSDPDMLLLDEPTNYLDIASIRWLERFLQAWKNELMLITHDRSFMDKVTTHTLGIHRKRVRKIEGNTAKLYEQMATEEEIYEKTRLNDEKRRKEVELFISRFRAKARLANMVQSRVKTLKKQEQKNKLDKIEALEFSFKFSPFSAKIMMDVRDLAFRYPGQSSHLFSGLNLTIAKDDRICIVGKNGEGKTTLQKLLAGALKPIDGEIRPHPLLKRGFYEQTNTAELDLNRTVEEEIAYASENCTHQMARDIAGAMMFSGSGALKKISVLSGGEKSRVMLGKLLVSPCHLLLLDEPTNHLDMESCDSLMAAIDAFDGAVVLVTHNEMFLHTLATRLVVFDRGRHTVFEGSYQRFLDDVGWESDDAVRRRSVGKQIQVGESSAATTEGVGFKEPGSAAPDRKTLRKKKAELVQQRSRKLKPLESRIVELEASIEEAEEEMGRLNKGLIDASTSGDSEQIADLAKKQRYLQVQLDGQYAELDRVTLDFEQQEAEFAAQIEMLQV